ncbi:MAG TPA: hypothetical protein VH308_01490 [Terracidiphilus sp.]|nr:hypothetical protein [Terracidiphilus sp.]
MPDEINGRTHLYHAEASILSGFLRLPLVQGIKSQASVTLPEGGGYLSQRAEAFRLEGVISFRSGYTQVAGNRSTKPGQGWTTLTTTAVEGLNVLDVVTADRIVGQTITEHPIEGHIPTVNFLGTRFDNLRIAGHPVKLDLDLNILGPKPANDESYAQDSGLISRVGGQYSRVLEDRELPDELRERYNRLSSTLGSPEAVECSLVNVAAGAYPGRSFGHVIDVPDFGKIILGKVTVTHEDYKQGTKTPRKTTVRLTMIHFELGCAADGDLSLDDGSTNGGTIP